MIKITRARHRGSLLTGHLFSNHFALSSVHTISKHLGSIKLSGPRRIL